LNARGDRKPSSALVLRMQMKALRTAQTARPFL
jgi:hypothetical protein